MKHKFLYEDLTIYGEKGEDPHTINVEVNLDCTDKGMKATFHPDHGGDPGHPPEWEIKCIWLQHPSMGSVMLTETQFVLIFPDGQDILNNALEDAHENGQLEKDFNYEI